MIPTISPYTIFVIKYHLLGFYHGLLTKLGLLTSKHNKDKNKIWKKLNLNPNSKLKIQIHVWLLNKIKG